MKRLDTLIVIAVLLVISMFVWAQPPAPSVRQLPGSDSIRVMIVPGESVKIFARASRVKTSVNEMSGEELVEIDTRSK